MKCTKIQRIVLTRDEDELSPEIHRHLGDCPACHRMYQQACDCRRLVALKRYEAPSELRREQCLSMLHDRLVLLERQEKEAVRRFGPVSHPAIRYGAAAAVVALIALHLVSLPRAPSLRSALTDRDLNSRSFEEFLAERNREIMLGAGFNRLFSPTSPLPFEAAFPPAERRPDRPPSVFFASGEQER